MPYTNIPGHEKVLFVRVTEATGAWSCPLPAWNDKNHPKKHERPRRTHYSAVRGTSVHNSIDDYIIETEHLPRQTRRPRPLSDLKVIYEDIKKPPQEQVMKWEIQRCMINFHKWWKKAKNEYKIEVLYSEKTMWSTEHKVAGTTDIICKMEINGRIYLVIIDWKSGRVWMENYKYQTSGYRGLSDEMRQKGEIELPRKIPFYHKNLTVMLGDISPKEIWSGHDWKGFLGCVRIYRHPPKQANQGGSCTFCGDYYRCEFANPQAKNLEYVPTGAET